MFISTIKLRESEYFTILSEVRSSETMEMNDSRELYALRNSVFTTSTADKSWDYRKPSDGQILWYECDVAIEQTSWPHITKKFSLSGLVDLQKIG